MKNDIQNMHLDTMIEESWKIIAPVWPLKTFIARNPLLGFEHLSFEEALNESSLYFQKSKISDDFKVVNREFIKWCQAFFDNGQAIIGMPFRDLGFYEAWKNLAVHDNTLIKNSGDRFVFFEKLGDCPEKTIAFCLSQFAIPEEQKITFLKHVLSLFPGWAGYVKYLNEWKDSTEDFSYSATYSEYLAVQLSLILLLCPNPKSLLILEDSSKSKTQDILYKIEKTEERIRKHLFQDLKTGLENIDDFRNRSIKDVQLVFCIDVRSEPFRKRLEEQGSYETLGFAGFFGLPISIENYMTEKTHSACPVLLKPTYKISEKPKASFEEERRDKKRAHYLKIVKQFYESLKYTFTTPFALAESLGPWYGISILLKTLVPLKMYDLKKQLKNKIRPQLQLYPEIKSNEDDKKTGIPFDDQIHYAKTALLLMGLKKHFSKCVIFCGHGSTTENNAYASALECGACGGNAGGMNAKILARILNQESIKEALRKEGFAIPSDTYFMAAEHNTTTDSLVLYQDEPIVDKRLILILIRLNADLKIVQEKNIKKRFPGLRGNVVKKVYSRAYDWAETRPEWGLVNNAFFIIGPRTLTNILNLDGRAFLHSYDYREDEMGKYLEMILTAPLVVGQWINNQYLFSTLDNRAFGGGSKITQNITGKMGIIQGNSSDLMHGLALQSVNLRDDEPLHEPARLSAVVYAPKEWIDEIIAKHAILKKLFSCAWVHLSVIEPKNNVFYHLNRDLTWRLAN